MEKYGPADTVFHIQKVEFIKESTQFNIAPESRQVQLYKCHTSRELTEWTDDCKLVKHAGHNFPMNVKEMTDI